MPSITQHVRPIGGPHKLVVNIQICVIACIAVYHHIVANWSHFRNVLAFVATLVDWLATCLALRMVAIIATLVDRLAASLALRVAAIVATLVDQFSASLALGMITFVGALFD